MASVEDEPVRLVQTRLPCPHQDDGRDLHAMGAVGDDSATVLAPPGRVPVRELVDFFIAIRFDHEGDHFG
eukprot:8208088-Heterocapsa_arctica.AAC.1